MLAKLAHKPLSFRFSVWHPSPPPSRSQIYNGGYAGLEDGEKLDSYPLGGIFDQPLPCCGCGIGWFSFLLGMIFPVAWFFGTILYLTNYYRSDPRERAGLGACAVAALICTVGVIIILLVMLLNH